MRPELPNIVFGPWISDAGFLLFGMYTGPGRAIALRREEYSLLLALATHGRAHRNSLIRVVTFVKDSRPYLYIVSIPESSADV
jgi:hypothetical protein